MHQPYYKDNSKDITTMPWVFLHAIKDYYDIPWYLSRFDKLKATFNLVPSLLTQLEAYIDGTANDKLLDILKKDVNFLKIEEKDFLEEYLFLCNEENMIKPLPRFNELRIKFKSENKSLDNFSNQEVLDLQTLFLLSWCGNYLRTENVLIKELLKKQRDFSRAEKLSLIEELLEFLKEIIPFYRSLHEKGQIDISTTPFYHPILPILLDRNSAKEAKHDVTLPPSVANYEEYASLQVKKAIMYFQNTFNFKPKGFWPSEGSVSLKTAKLLGENKIKWFCSDEEILFKSLNLFDKKALYKPYRLDLEGEEINIFFRDKYLSDLIGFDFSKKEPKEAAQDFINHLKNIYLDSKESCIVPIILDGENAWDFYKNNAWDFFEELYSLLEKETSWCKTILFDETENIEDLKAEKLSTLATGSWINGNFDIWIGSCEKNKAWQLLDTVKNNFDVQKENLDKETIEKIDEEFLIALGSDWFWWYGDDHHSDVNHYFDEQFRFHIKNIYELMKQEVPREVFNSIVEKSSKSITNKTPTDYIRPTVDGNMSNFFEWLNSGYIDIKKEFSTMDSTSIIEKLYYGIDREHSLYIYFEGQKLKDLKKDLKIKIEINNIDYIFDLKRERKKLEQKEKSFIIAFDMGLELKLENFNLKKADFSFELLEKNNVIQMYPKYDKVVFDFENLFLKSWYI